MNSIDYWPDLPDRLCQVCLEAPSTGADQACDSCAADHAADREWEWAQERAREQADLDEVGWDDEEEE